MSRSRYMTAGFTQGASALLRKLWSWVPFTASPSAYIEGGKIGGSNRRWIPGSLGDARFDASITDLVECQRKSRYYEWNDSLSNRLADLFEQFTVGATGLQYVPASDDEAWNERALTWWRAWERNADLTSRRTFGELQRLVARRWFFDGEVFILLTRGDGSLPRIQLIESHRVGTPDKHQSDNRVIDGIKIDDHGRPISYFIRDDVEGETYREWKASDVVHVFAPNRIGQYRGFPFLTPVINDLQDLEELQILSKQIAKDAASRANIIHTESGEVNSDDSTRGIFNVRSRNTANEEVTESRDQYFSKVLGARTVALKSTERFEQFKSDRPSPSEMEFWKILSAKVCNGVGISKQLVFPESVQGTVARSDLDIANAFFRSRSYVLQRAFGRVYEWSLGWARQYDRAISDAPPTWRAHSVEPPRAVNVDVGRNSAAMLAQVDSGALTLSQVYGQRGENWKEQLAQRGKEEAYINFVASKYGVSPDRIRKSVAGYLDRVKEITPEPEEDELLVPEKKNA